MVKYQLLQTLYSLNLTESTINHAVFKIAKTFGSIYQEMISELKKEANIHGDETSWRLNGKNYWLWTFVGKWVVIYEIDQTRSRMCQRESLVGLKATLQVTRILHGIMLVKPTKDATFIISERLKIHTIQESRKRIHSICSTPKENTVCLSRCGKNHQ